MCLLGPEIELELALDDAEVDREEGLGEACAEDVNREVLLLEDVKDVELLGFNAAELDSGKFVELLVRAMPDMGILVVGDELVGLAVDDVPFVDLDGRSVELELLPGLVGRIVLPVELGGFAAVHPEPPHPVFDQLRGCIPRLARNSAI